MSLFLWGIVGLLVGIVLFIAAGILCAPYLSTQRREQMANVYYGLAMTAMDRAMLVRRLNGGYTIKASEYDSEHSTERVSIGGEPKDLNDVANLLTRAYKRPFGVNFEGYDVVTDARHAEIGEWHHEHVQSGNHQTESGYASAFTMPSIERIVDPAATKHIMPSSTEPGDRNEASELVKESLAKHKTKDPVDVMIIAGVYAGMMGLVWFLASQGGSIGSSVMSAAGAILVGVPL